MNKLKILWFCLLPIAWFIAFKLVQWVEFYPISCEPTTTGLCIFLIMTEVFGTVMLIGVSLGIALLMQD